LTTVHQPEGHEGFGEDLGAWGGADLALAIVRGRTWCGAESSHRASMGQVLVQIALLDIVFSLDSVITAEE
jgi:predicted tellurium resistance membrane protein TerC